MVNSRFIDKEERDFLEEINRLENDVEIGVQLGGLRENKGFNYIMGEIKKRAEEALVSLGCCDPRNTEAIIEFQCIYKLYLGIYNAYAFGVNNGFESLEILKDIKDYKGED